MIFIWRVVSILAVLTGILSLVSLFNAILTLGLAAPLEPILEYYHALLTALLGWADNPLQKLISSIRDQFGIGVELYPLWKDLFVLLWLYFSSDVKTNWVDRRGFAIMSLLLAVPFALVTSHMMGFSFFQNSNTYLLSSIMPVAGIFLFEFIRAFWISIFRLSTPSMDPKNMTRAGIFVYCIMQYVLPVAYVAGISTIIVWATERIYPGLWGANITPVTLASFILIMAFWRIGRGAQLAIHDRANEERFFGRFLRSGSTRLGLALLGVILGLIVFLGLNAGLKSWGL